MGFLPLLLIHFYYPFLLFPHYIVDSKMYLRKFYFISSQSTYYVLGPIWIRIGTYTLSEFWSGVNWADLMAAHGAFGTDFYDRSILRPKDRAYFRSGRPVIKTGPKGALGSHEIRPIHSAPSLGQSIHIPKNKRENIFTCMYIDRSVVTLPT